MVEQLSTVFHNEVFGRAFVHNKYISLEDSYCAIILSITLDSIHLDTTSTPDNTSASILCYCSVNNLGLFLQERLQGQHQPTQLFEYQISHHTP